MNKRFKNVFNILFVFDSGFSDSLKVDKIIIREILNSKKRWNERSLLAQEKMLGLLGGSATN
jgi:hypothetical protein